MISFYNFNLRQPWPGRYAAGLECGKYTEKKSVFGGWVGTWADFEFLAGCWIINAAIDFHQAGILEKGSTKVNQKIKLQPETEDG